MPTFHLLENPMYISMNSENKKYRNSKQEADWGIKYQSTNNCPASLKEVIIFFYTLVNYFKASELSN